MHVPFYGLDREFRRHKRDILRILKRVWGTGVALQGPDVAELEELIAERCGRRFAVATGSCTDALAFALMANGIGSGDEVLVTTFSFFASVSAILRVGAIPRLLDIEPHHYMMDVESLGQRNTDNTKAIVAVHLFGQTLPMEKIEAFARSRDLVLIEDAAQALGGRDGTRPAGSMGHASCFSFDPTKMPGSFGSGGMLLTDDESIAEHVRRLRYHGRNRRTRLIEELGYNSQLSTDKAAVLAFKLSRLEEWLDQRREISDLYIDGLSGLEEVQPPRSRPGSSHTWHKFVIRARHRDDLAAALADAGVETMVHYPRVLCDEPCLQRSPRTWDEVPVAREATAQVLSLPIFPQLTTGEARYVVDSIKSFYAGKVFHAE